MFTIYKHEIKAHIKALLIWCLSVGGMGFFCIVLFSSMKESIGSMADSFSSMGAFSDALGMNQLSIATLAGFYSAEVGTIHSLGSAMFAAIISTGMLSKEEEGHTSEFLFSLPISRHGAVTAKLLAVASLIILFNVICVILYSTGILILGEDMPAKEFILYHVMQVLMNFELAGICYAISAFMKKNKLGIGLGIVLLLYAYDLIARVIPDLNNYKIISPFSFANAADILSSGTLNITAMIIGTLVLFISIIIACIVYDKKDLAT